MKTIYRYFTLLLLLIIIACNGPKSLTKKGIELYNVGMYNEATDYFLRALTKKPDYVEGKVALKNCADKYLGIKKDTFFVANNREDWGVVVYTYLDMVKYVEKVKTHVDVSVPSHYKEDFDLAKGNYLDQRFKKANILMAKEDFAAAEVIYNEISSLDENYKDVAVLKKIAKIEPIYRRGLAAMKNEKFRQAYYAFQEVISQDAAYKDAAVQSNEALTMAQFTVAFSKFQNYSNMPEAGDVLASKIISNVINHKGPFLKVIDRTNTEYILKEQKLTMTGAVDANTAANAGNLLGAKAVVLGTLIDAKVYETPVTSKTVKGFESYLVQKINPQTQQPYYETNYKKVTYNEFNGSRQVTMSFEYKMISTTTGEILLTGLKTLTQSSSVHYIQYNGNKDNLCGGTWYSLNVTSPQDVVYSNFEQRKQIKDLLKASTVLETKDSLMQKLYNQISAEVSCDIYSYNPEK